MPKIEVLRMVTIEIVIIVINFTRVMGIRVTISCRYCIVFEVMLLFLVYFPVCHAPSLRGRSTVRLRGTSFE